MDDFDVESIYDSEDDVENNVMDVDADDPDNQNFVQNGQQNIVDLDVEVITDSEDESINNDPPSPIDLARHDPEQNIADQDVDVITDSEDEDDDIGDFALHANQTFTLTVERHRLNRPLLTAPNGSIQAWEQIILSLAKTLRFKECYESMLMSFKIANLGFDDANLPETMRDFWLIVNRREENFVCRVVCTACWVIVGEGKVPTRDCRCGQCGPGRKNAQLGSYLYIILRPLIEGLLSRPHIAEDLRYPYTRTKRNNDAIEDVYDGDVYRRLSAEGEFLHENNHNYSFALWADGVSPVKTANVHIMPVFLQILEFPPRARQRNSILAAVYVGPQKPEMGSFLTPVMEELQDLFIDGVRWRPNGNEERISRFVLLILSADSEERYKILGMTRHNGHFGCTYCMVDGVPNEEGNHRLVYATENEAAAAERTDAGIRQDAQLAAEVGVRINGVESISALSAIRVDLRACQKVEELHCFWKGNFDRLYGNLTNSQREHHITADDLAIISERITSIRTPTKMSRTPRDLTSFKNFTGTESRNTAWHYWLPCANEFLNANQRRLCASFAEATFILNKDSILRNELDEAERLLDVYRESFRDSFPQNQWVYNVHLLKHAAQSVRDLGPAWVASGLWFESLNRQVVNYLTSPTDRAWQVACRMLLAQMLEKCLNMPLSPAALNLLRELIGKDRWVQPPDVATGTYVLIREEGTETPIAAQEIAALRQAGFNDLGCAFPITKYKKICIDGVMYQVTRERITKYNNSIAVVNAPHLQGLDFIEIRSVVSWQHEQRGEQLGIFGTRFRTIGPAFETSYMKIVERLNDLVYVALTHVVAPGVLMQPVEDITYISQLPNRWDND